MSVASRKLQVGDRVTTDFSRNITEHEIIERAEMRNMQGGVGFRVRPLVPGSTGEFISADWFEPASAKEGGGAVADEK